jgi:predicted helicase
MAHASAEQAKKAIRTTMQPSSRAGLEASHGMVKPTCRCTRYLPASFITESKPPAHFAPDLTHHNPAAQQVPEIEEWREAIFAKIVLKCGDRRYWETWAADIAVIAQRHIDRITLLLADGGTKPRKAFDAFLAGLHENLNPSITQEEAIEMLAQHLITKPVFDTLFEGYQFTQQNPVSVSMQKILRILEGQALEKETATLDKFYASVRDRASGIDNAEGKQKIIVELYDKFFRIAFDT